MLYRVRDDIAQDLRQSDSVTQNSMRVIWIFTLNVKVDALTLSFAPVDVRCLLYRGSEVKGIFQEKRLAIFNSCQILYWSLEWQLNAYSSALTSKSLITCTRDFEAT